MALDWSRAGSEVRELWDALVDALPDLAVALVVFTAFYVAGRAMGGAARRLGSGGGRPPRAGLVLGRLAQAVLVFFGVLVALSVVFPSFTADDLITLLGIMGVAIGFAFRDILQNFLAGILLLVTQPFRIGDQIVAAGHEGTVVDIETRATHVRTYDGRRAVIPNATLFTGAVLVNTAFEERRGEVEVPLPTAAGVDRARDVLLEAVRGVDGVLQEPPPDALLSGFDGDKVKVRFRWWTRTTQANAVAVHSRVLKAMRDAATAHGLGVPFAEPRGGAGAQGA